MANNSTMPKMGDGLTMEDIEEIQSDARKNIERRLREAREDGRFTPTSNWKGMESHLREDTPEYEAMMREKTAIKK